MLYFLFLFLLYICIFVDVYRVYVCMYVCIYFVWRWFEMVVIQWYAPVNLYSPQIKKKEMKKVGAWTFANYNGNSIKFCQSR